MRRRALTAPDPSRASSSRAQRARTRKRRDRRSRLRISSMPMSLSTEPSERVRRPRQPTAGRRACARRRLEVRRILPQSRGTIWGRADQSISRRHRPRGRAPCARVDRRTKRRTAASVVRMPRELLRGRLSSNAGGYALVLGLERAKSPDALDEKKTVLFRAAAAEASRVRALRSAARAAARVAAARRRCASAAISALRRRRFRLHTRSAILFRLHRGLRVGRASVSMVLPARGEAARGGALDRRSRPRAASPRWSFRAPNSGGGGGERSFERRGACPGWLQAARPLSHSIEPALATRAPSRDRRGESRLTLGSRANRIARPLKNRARRRRAVVLRILLKAHLARRTGAEAERRLHRVTCRSRLRFTAGRRGRDEEASRRPSFPPADERRRRRRRRSSAAARSRPSLTFAAVSHRRVASVSRRIRPPPPRAPNGEAGTTRRSSPGVASASGDVPAREAKIRGKSSSSRRATPPAAGTLRDRRARADV